MPDSSNFQDNFMKMAVALAGRGVGRCGTNPSVGCVIVKDGKLVARGWTKDGGRPHAETIALLQAGKEAKGSDLYASLEPCAHYGQTPPCVNAIIEAGVKRVIYGLEDPDPRVSGKGIVALKKAGIQVLLSNLAKEKLCAPILGYLQRQNKGIPYFSLKIASSRDGKIALPSGESQWITGVYARRHVHLLRARSDALLTGIGTVLVDDPLLTCRLRGLEKFSPPRIVLDTKLRLPLESQIVASAKDYPLWVISAEGASEEKKSALEKKNVKLFEVTAFDPKGRISLQAVAHLLGEKGINHVLVEAGPQIAASFLQQDMLGRIYHYNAPIWMGGESLSAIGPIATPSINKAKISHPVAHYSFASDRLDIFDIT